METTEQNYKERIARRVRGASYRGSEESSQELKSEVFKKYEQMLREKQEDAQLSSLATKEQNIMPLNQDAIFTKEFQSFEFRGKAFEYFKIWIVNIFLTIITLGIYSAWAKVRANRYLYANTFLNGANFEYNADPKRILYGRLIVFGFYALFIIFSDVLYLKVVASLLALTFIILLPWLISKAIAFKYKSTSYRNIRFHYKGRVRSFYYIAFLFVLPYILMAVLAISMPVGAKYVPALKAYLDIVPIILIVLILGSVFIYYPIWYKAYKSLIINYGYYGKEKFSFKGKNGEIILIFIKIVFLMFVFVGLVSLFTLFISQTFSLNIKEVDFQNGLHFFAVYVFMMLIYLVVIGFFKGLSDGYLSNFVRNNTTLAEGEFQGTIKPLRLAFISSSNALLLILSLGLLYPYTKLRYLKYKIENTHFACANYDKFLASQTDDISTIGEESVDFFDIEIGI